MGGSQFLVKMDWADCEKKGMENVYSFPFDRSGTDGPLYAIRRFHEHDDRKSVMASDTKST